MSRQGISRIRRALGRAVASIQPLEASAGPGVRIGVGSGERDDSPYRLVVEFGDEEGEATEQLELAPGQKQVLEFEPPDASPIVTTGGSIPVTATLFKEDSPDPDRPFRQVSTYISSAGGSE